MGLKGARLSTNPDEASTGPNEVREARSECSASGASGTSKDERSESFGTRESTASPLSCCK
ncbi:hypothetical protein BRD19_02120 [Halobacteriales archaeon SW_7_65_23]|nr:MAG: hypothetical protein BRD19_02120 [Halobacteriales archaeon SW_7_65_23]